MNLTRVELSRLVHRRFLRLLPLALLLVLGVTWYGVNDMARYSVVAPAEMEQWYQQALADWEEYGEEQMAMCLEDQERERERAQEPDLDFGCDQMEPQREHYVTELDLRREHETVLSGVGFVFLFLALMAGATGTAAEYTHRTVGTWLTFEPRRSRVFASKVVAAGLLTLPVALLAGTVLLLGTSAIFRFNGAPTGMDGEDWRFLAWMVLRVSVLSAVVASVGAAAGMLLRNTAGVLGVFVGYAFVVELMLLGLIERLQLFSLVRNVNAWAQDGASWFIYDCDEFQCRETLMQISLERGALVLALVCSAVLLLGWWRFTRTDAE